MTRTAILADAARALDKARAATRRLHPDAELDHAGWPVSCCALERRTALVIATREVLQERAA